MSTSTSSVSSSSSGLASISGLASGIDTTSLIKSLMTLEAAPQTALKSRLSTSQAQLTALQAINTKLASLTTSASTLATGTALKTMSAAATSSVDTTTTKGVTATVTGAPPAGSLSISVTAVAVAERREFTGNAGTTSGWAPPARTGTFPVTMTAAGVTQTFDAASYSAADVAAAINSHHEGVNAAVIADSNGTPHLVLTAKAGNYAAAAPPGFELTLTDGSNATVASGKVVAGGVSGADAEIVVNGITKTSKSNTFTDVVSGLDVTLGSLAGAGTTATVTTARDTAATSTSVSGVVSQISAVLSDIAFHTTAPQPGVKASAVNGGLLAGNSTLRAVSDALVKAVSAAAAASGATTADTGIEVTTAGDVTVDTTKLTSFLTRNPVIANTLLTTLGTDVSKIASDASLSGSEDSLLTGSISRLVASAQNKNTRLTSEISNWDVRLAIRQKTLTAQYTAMETALSKLQAQSSALTAALKQLETD